MSLLLDGLRTEARNLYRSWNIATPVFDIRTGWARSYDDIFDETFDLEVSAEEIFGRVLGMGRAILTGRGGDGKTTLLRRLYAAALDRGMAPIFIDLTKWTGKDYDEWLAWTVDELDDGMDFLLRQFSGIDAGALDLDMISPEVSKIVLVDGLNEISLRVGNDVLVVLDRLASEQLNTSVIVTDRLIRRSLPNASRWRIGMVRPLSNDEIRKYVGAKEVVPNNDIRRSPLFLDTHIKFGGRASRSDSLRKRLVDHAGLDSDELTATSRAAFELYRQHARSFYRVVLIELVGDEVVAKLEGSGALRSEGGVSFFQHHLLHDYLAAKFMAESDESTWTPDNFRTLSFDGGYFDAVELAFEQLPAGLVDRYLRRLYDYNLYGAGYALALERTDDAALSSEMRVVILAMLAEKKFDAILATRERAMDALRVMQQDDAEAYRSAVSLGDVIALVNSYHSTSDWFAEWRRLFSLSVEGAVSNEILSKVSDVDSIVGWTVANVLRRGRDNAWMVEPLHEYLGDATPTVRWRVAHVLGSIPTNDAQQILLSLVDDDEDIDVRYGAIRSLVELACAADESLRNEVRGAIEERAPRICDVRLYKLARELRSCLIVDESQAPSDWLDFVRACVRYAFAWTEKSSERDLWRGCLNLAEDMYGARSSASAVQ